MKRQRKLVGGLMTVFAFCFLFANVITVQAYTTANKVQDGVYVDAVTNAKGNWVDTTKRRINTFSISKIGVEFGENATIQNLKSNKKGLEVKQTYYDASYSSHSIYDAAGNSTGSFKYGRATISLYATKAGSYKVSFNVMNSAGAKVKSVTVNVLAVNDGSVIKTATLGKTKLRTSSAKIKNGELTVTKTSTSKVTANTGKLKITANSKYKITGFVVEGVNKSGNAFYKKYKNNKNITLSQGYQYQSKSAYGSSSKTGKKYTYIYVSYKDTFTGDTYTYAVTKKRGKKEIVETYKNKLTGETKVKYSPSATLKLWNY